jgi:hypothetical protein
MKGQLSLFFFAGDDKIARNFAKFHADNPQVYERLRVLALQARRFGWEHYGIGALCEVVRYERNMKTKSADGLKLNDNYRALYARLLEQSEPELVGFFFMRMRRPVGAEGQIVDPGDTPSPPVDRFDQPIQESS